MGRAIVQIVHVILVGAIALKMLGLVGVSTAEQTHATEKQQSSAPEQESSAAPNSKVRDIALIASPLISLIGVGLIVYFTRLNIMSEQRFKSNQAEATFIQDKLDRFHGPFLLMSTENRLLAQDLRSRQDQPENHRLLDKLFDKNWKDSLGEGDKSLVTEICENAGRLRDMISQNAGLVDPALLPYLSRVLAHFRVLQMAYNSKLGTDKSSFLRYVYPKSLDHVLREDMERLQARLQAIRAAPTNDHGPLPDLDVQKYPLDPWPDHGRPNYHPDIGLIPSSPPIDS